MNHCNFRKRTKLRDVDLPQNVSNCYFDYVRNQIVESEQNEYHTHSYYCSPMNCSSKQTKNKFFDTLCINKHSSYLFKNSIDQRIREKVAKYYREYGMKRHWPNKSVRSLDLPGSHMQLLFGQPMDWNSENIYATVLLNGVFVALTDNCCSPDGPVICLWDSTNPRGLLLQGYESSWKNEQLNIPMQPKSGLEQGERQAYVTSLQFSKVQKDILAVGFEGGIIEIWGLGSLKSLSSEIISSKQRPKRLREPLCRSCDSDIDIRFFSINELKNWDRSAITCLAWHPSQMVLCTGSLKGPVCVWSFRSRNKLPLERYQEIHNTQKFLYQSLDERDLFNSPYIMTLEFRISPERINCTISMAWNFFGTILAIGTEIGTLGLWNYKKASKFKERINKMEPNNTFKQMNLSKFSKLATSAEKTFSVSKNLIDIDLNISNISPIILNKSKYEKQSNEFSKYSALNIFSIYKNNSLQKEDSISNVNNCKINLLSRSIFKLCNKKNYHKNIKEKQPSELLIKKLNFFEKNVPNEDIISSLGLIRSIENAHSGMIGSLIWNNHDHNVLLSGGGGDDDGCINLWRITEIGNIIPLFSIDVESKITSMMWSDLTGELLVSHSSDRNREEVSLANFSSNNPCSSPQGGRWGISVWCYCYIEECIYKIGEFGNRPMAVKYEDEYGSHLNLIDRDNAYCLLQSPDGKYIVYWSLPLEHVSVWAMTELNKKCNSKNLEFLKNSLLQNYYGPSNNKLQIDQLTLPIIQCKDKSKKFTLFDFATNSKNIRS